MSYLWVWAELSLWAREELSWCGHSFCSSSQEGDQNVRSLGGMKSYSWNLNQIDFKATEFVCKKTFKILAVIRKNNIKFIVLYI